MTSDEVCSCGGTLAVDADWCPRCFARRPAQPTASTPGVAHRAFGTVAAVPPPSTQRPPTGRFAKTEVSFGLPGRIILTILLLLPLAVFIYLATQLIGIGGIVVYGGIVCPWALRDLWRHPGRG